MSIESDRRIAELEKRVEALEKRLTLPEVTTQDLCNALQAKIDAERKTLKLPEKRKSA